MEEDKIEMGFRVLGNEIMGFYLNSTSKKKNWVITSCIVLLFLAILANQLTPLLMILLEI